jgi:hypothetical protein
MGGNGPVFYANPAATGVIPSGLAHTWGTTPTSPAYYFDAAGNLQTAPNNLIGNSAIVGGSGWTTSGVVFTNSAQDPFGGNTATTFTATSQYNSVYYPIASYTPSATYIVSGWIRLSAGSLSTPMLQTYDGIGYQTLSVSATSLWQRFYKVVTLSASATLLNVYFQENAASGFATYQLYGFQVERVTAAQTTPNPFMPTSGSAYYGPVVNDHNPSTLAALGLRSEPQITGNVPNNAMIGATPGSARTISGVTSITRTASASAVILATTTNAAVGDLLTISGASPSTYNGTWAVTAATANVSVTVATATSATDSASGYGVAAVSPGTLPTGWTIIGLPAGVSYSVVANTVESGIPKLSLLVGGTSSSGSIAFASLFSSPYISVSASQAIAMSSFGRVSAGSLGANTLQYYYWYTNSGVFVSNASGAVFNSAASILRSSLMSSSVTVPASGVNQVIPYLAINIAANAATNFTIDLGASQLYFNAFATSPILTYGTAVTVLTDNWSFTGAARTAMLSPQGACIAVRAQAEGVSSSSYPALFGLDDGTAFNHIRVYMNALTTQAQVDYETGGSTNYGPTINGGDITAAPRTAVLSYNSRALLSYDGSAAASFVALPPAGLTNARLGGVYGATSFYGWFSQIMIRQNCTAAQVQRYSTAGANLQAENDNDWPAFANDNLPLIVKLASGEWR